MIKYYPYKSDKPNKKYYIITNDTFDTLGFESTDKILNLKTVKKEQAEKQKNHQIGLGHHENQRLVGEQRLDALEERHLLLDAVAAGLGQIDEVQDGGVDVCQRGDGLHLDSVAFVEWVV